MNQTTETRSVAAFLRAVFVTLERQRITYCVLHGYEDLPEHMSSDLDLAIDQEDSPRLNGFIRSMEAAGYRAVQCLQYAVGARYFVFVWEDGAGDIQTAAVDFIWEHRRCGLLLASGADLVRDRQRRGEFWIPSLATEFSYLLAKKLLKGGVTPLQANKLGSLVSKAGDRRAVEVVEAWCGPKWASRLVAACKDGTLERMIAADRSSIWRAALLMHPLRAVRWSFAEALRVAARWRKPTGLFAVVLGPDGSGKSTLLNSLPSQLGILFRRSRRFHLRPGVLIRRRASGPTTEPHAQVARSALMSVGALAAGLLDQIVGYWLRVRPAIARTSLVLFDRYICDMLADPRRYRYGGPQWIAGAACGIAPKPDLILVLDAAEDVIMARKQEVDWMELERQRRAYQGLARRYGAVLIDANLPADQVARLAAGAVADALAARFRQRDFPGLVPGGWAKRDDSLEQLLSSGDQR